jgi:adenosylcobinamide-phosphate synthase
MLDILLPALVCVVALILDRLIGEPQHHPLVWFGNAAAWFEKRFNNHKSRFKGGFSVLILVGAPVSLVWILQFTLNGSLYRPILDIVILTFVIGWQSMKEHALAVYTPLVEADLPASRDNLAMIVSRDTGNLDEQQIAGSTIESVLENAHDCLFASLFWYALLGPAGALLHRLVNTLDAMWGYKNQRYLKFGFVAARLDDCLGYLSARLTAVGYILCGASKNAIESWQNQIGKHKSPNAGLVMATGAGAMAVTIGGPVSYEGTLQEKPFLGLGNPAQAADIPRSIKLIEKTLLLWMLIYTALLPSLSLV